MSLVDRLLNNTVWIKRMTGRDPDGGAPLYTAPVKINAYVNPKVSVTRNAQGIEATSTIRLITGPKDAVFPQDMVSMNGDFDDPAHTFSVLSAGPQRDIDGELDHHEARL